MVDLGADSLDLLYGNVLCVCVCVGGGGVGGC